MGKQISHLAPAPGVIALSEPSSYNFILFDPERFHHGITHFQRLSPGDTLTIDPKVNFQEHVFNSPQDAFRQQFSVSHTGDSLVFKEPLSEHGTVLCVIGDSAEVPQITNHRKAALERVQNIYTDPLEPLSPEKAMASLKAVNNLLGEESSHCRDSLGNPGGLLKLPDHVRPVVVGDLHAQVDNLLTILSENSFLESLDNGSAALIILGDAVHSQEPGKLDEMDSSLFMMDLIFKLKIQYPEQVFYILGNHDSFDTEVMKLGVPQGLLWKKHVTASRGEEYKVELEKFYRQSPLLLISKYCIACHAGPTRGKTSRQMLINAHQSPETVHDLTWSRIKSSSFPTGYTRNDVRQFRKDLDVSSDTVFIVGHNPYSNEKTVWLNAGQIEHHHIVISYRPEWVGLFACIDSTMVPQLYPVSPLTQWLREKNSSTTTH